MVEFVSEHSFSGGGNISGDSGLSLAAVIRGLAQDIAKTRLNVSTVGNFTDNSGGTADSGRVLRGMVVPTEPYDGRSSGAAPANGFNNAINGFQNAFKVMENRFKLATDRISTTRPVATQGTQGTAGTIAALTASLSASSGNAAIDFTTGTVAMRALRKDIVIMASGLNRILVAIGSDKITSVMDDEPFPTEDTATATIANATAGTGSPRGTTSISDTVMDAFLTSARNNVATIAATWNGAMRQTGFATAGLNVVASD